MLEKAQERAGKAQLTTKSIKINLKVNATLGNGEIEVKAASDELGETLETDSPEAKGKSEAIQREKLTPKLKEEPYGEKFRDQSKTIKDVGTIEDIGTIEDTDFDFKPLYHLEILREGKWLDTIPIIKREITIGRDEEDSASNIRLKSNNRKISRLHASLRLEENGEIWVTALHKNPVIVSGKAITQAEKAELDKNGVIQIYEFTLRLRFLE